MIRMGAASNGFVAVSCLLFALLALIPFQSANADDATLALCSKRYERMIDYVQHGHLGALRAWGIDQSGPGLTASEAVYDFILNKASREVKLKYFKQIERQEVLYQTLVGLLTMHKQLLGEDEAITEDYAAQFKEMGLWLEIPRQANTPLAFDKLDKATLLRSDDAVVNAIADKDIAQVMGGLALAVDAQALLQRPVVASNRALGIVEAIQQSTDDKDLIAACQRLAKEITTERADYLARLKTVATSGELAGIIKDSLLTKSISGATVMLLEKLGYGVAGNAGTIAASCFTAFVTGMKIGLWLTGESNAYEYARLAHFADYIRPGVAKTWRQLRDKLSLNDLETCRRFDAMTRALILIHAFTDEQEREMSQSFDKAVFPVGMAKDLQHLVFALTLDDYKKIYSEWVAGTAFRSYAGALAPVKLNGKWGIIDIKGNFVLPPTYEQIGRWTHDPLNLDAGLIVVKQNGKYGYIDNFGQLVIPCSFDSVGNFKNDVAYGKLNGKYVVIDRQGNVKPNEIYSKYVLVRKFENCSIVSVNQKLGIVDINDTYLVEPKYSSIHPLFSAVNPEYFSVQNTANDKYGIITIDGTIVYPLSLDKIIEKKSFTSGKRFIFGVIGNKCGIVKLGKQFSFIEIQNGVDSYGFDNSAPIISTDSDQLYANVIDENGRYLLPLNKYTDVSVFLYLGRYDDRAEVKTYLDNYLVVTDVQKKSFIIDRSLNIVGGNDNKYDQISQGFCDGMVWVRVDNKFGFLDRSFHLVIPPQYLDAGEFCNDTTAVQVKKGTPPAGGWKDGYTGNVGWWVYINKNNQRLTPLLYGFPSLNHCYFIDGFAAFRLYDKNGIGRNVLINRKGIPVLEYDSEDSIANSDIVGFDGQPELLYSQSQYFFMGFRYPGINRIKIKGKWGYIEGATVIVQPRYDDVGDFSYPN